MLEAAPLIETPDAQAPEGATAEWVRGPGGARLRAALFQPAPGRARGSIILSGGRTEPIEKYYETIADFLARGFVVLAHDWRGQGLSHRDLGDSLKGHASGFKAFLDDFRLLLNAYEDRLPKPWVGVGHSMGGCLTLLALASGETRLAGAVLSAPMLGLITGNTPKPVAKAMAAFHSITGGGGRYVRGDPGKPFDDDFAANRLTHDRERFARSCGLLAAEPKLALGAPTWGWLDFAFRATAYLERPERLKAITVPVVIVSAEDDKLVDNAAQQAAARHLPQGKFITVPGAFHEILMETDTMRNIFLRAFDALTGRVAPNPVEAPKPASVTPQAAAPTPSPAPTPTPTPAPAPAAAAPVAAAAAAKPPAAKKPVAKRAAAKKPAAAKAPAPAKAPAKSAAKPAAKKPAATKSPAKPATAKPAAAKPAPKAAVKPASAKPKPAAAKAPVASKAPAPKAVAKKPAAKPASAKPAASKPAAKATAKPAAATAPSAAKKPVARKPAPKK